MALASKTTNSSKAVEFALPGLTRTDGPTEVFAPEGVVAFDDGAGSPVRVSEASPLPTADAGLGADGTGGPTLPGGSTGVRGWLRYIASLIPPLVSGRVPVDGSGVTQPVSGTVGVSGSVAVTGTFFQPTQPVSAASLPLPTGAATEATLSTLSGKVPGQGQAAAAGSLPMVLASDQPAVPAYPTDPALLSVTHQSGATTTNNGTDGTILGYSQVVLDVTISGTATVAFRAGATSKGLTTIPVAPLAGGPAQTSITASGQYVASVAGMAFSRAAVTSYGSGTVDVTGRYSRLAGPHAPPTYTPAVTAQGVSGGTPMAVVGVLENPTSTFTRPADPNPYTQNDLIASSTTAGSVAVPSLTAARVAAGSFLLRRIRLSTNKTTGWDGVTLRVRLWSVAPTYASGDNGAYSVSTGAAGYLGQFDVTLAQHTDGAVGVGVPAVGGDVGVKLASGQVVYWDVQYVGSASLTPASGQTFTLTGEVYQN